MSAPEWLQANPLTGRQLWPEVIGTVCPASAPKPIPRSLLILRRRVLEEMRAPGPDGQPRFASDTQLAHFLDVDPSHISHFLRSQSPENVRGISWALVDKLAAVFEIEIWQLFFVAAATVPYKWRAKGPSGP